MQCYGTCGQECVIENMLCDVAMARVAYGTGVNESLQRMMQELCTDILDVVLLIVDDTGRVISPPVCTTAVYDTDMVRMKPVTGKYLQHLAKLKEGAAAYILVTVDGGARGEALMRSDGHVHRLRGARELISCAADLISRQAR